MDTARFTVAYWCVLIAACLPIVCAGIAKYGAFGKPRRDGGYDNHSPRDWLARKTLGHSSHRLPNRRACSDGPYSRGRAGRRRSR